MVAVKLPTLFKAQAEGVRTIIWNERRPRVIEHGLLSYPGEANFWIQAENFPLWLLALDRSFVRTIYLMGGSNAKSFLQEMRLQNCDVTLINLVIGRIGLGKVRYSDLPRRTPQDPSDLVLVSGSIEYIQRIQILPHTQPWFYATTTFEER
jgi:hypothetical protein